MYVCMYVCTYVVKSLLCYVLRSKKSFRLRKQTIGRCVGIAVNTYLGQPSGKYLKLITMCIGSVGKSKRKLSI